MVTIFRRFISLSVCLVALGLALSVTAVPAQAAGAITVGDDGARCHGSVSTIQDALTALGPNPKGRIVVCAGTYTTPTVVSGATSLAIIGRPGAILRAPSGFAGIMLLIQTSKKVTVKGLTFDGQGALGVSGSTLGTTAIYVFRSGANITGNTIVNWHTPGFASASVYMSAIRADQDAGQLVSVSKNTITDFQTRGITVSGPAKVNITRNTLSTTDTSTNNPIGIAVSGNPKGGKISRNILTSDQFPSGAAEQVGILVFEGSKFSVTGNTITHWFWGVAVVSYGDTTIGANNNKVSGNKIFDSDAGILIQSNAWGTYDAHADKNRVIGNRVINTANTGEAGIVIGGGNPAAGPDSFALDEVVKGNTITNFTWGVYQIGNTVISGKFEPNKVN